mgnify:CR=1 FL=1
MHYVEPEDAEKGPNMSSPILTPPGGESPWAGAAAGAAAGLGLFGLLGLGLGLGRRPKEPETKREKAWKASQTLSELCRDLESMTAPVNCRSGPVASVDPQ